MRKHLSKWHRRFGIFAALIAIYLSLTGLLLNHSHDLGLDHAHLSSPWMLQLYGIKTPEGYSVNTRQHSINKLGETLFVDDRIIGQFSSALVGATTLDQFLIIALRDSILLLSAEGEIVETLTPSNGLPGQIERVGWSDKGLFIQSRQQIYTGDADLLKWLPVNDTVPDVSWTTLEATATNAKASLLDLLPAYGPSWERVLQDLHSGRFFNLPGTLLIDLTGIILLLLSISGIVSFTLRKKAKRRRKTRH